MNRFTSEDIEIEYEVLGKGEPVLLVHLSIVPDGLIMPLRAQPELAAHYQLIHYYRRGYQGSTRGSKPLSIEQYALDAGAVLKHLNVRPAHVVGHSIGGAIAMQLAIDEPSLVHSLALLEPPLRYVPSARASFEQVNLPMINAYRSGNKQEAIEIFSNAIFGPNWQSTLDSNVPGGMEQVMQYVDIFMQEQPTIQEWQFGPDLAMKINQPVLSVVGSFSNPFMREGRALLHSYFPQTEDFDPQSTHMLQMQDPEGVAHGLAVFFGRHPISPA